MVHLNVPVSKIALRGYFLGPPFWFCLTWAACAVNTATLWMHFETYLWCQLYVYSKRLQNLFLHPQGVKHVMAFLPWTQHMMMQIGLLHFRICSCSTFCLWECSLQHIHPLVHRESQMSFWMAGEEHRSVIVCSGSKLLWKVFAVWLRNENYCMLPSETSKAPITEFFPFYELPKAKVDLLACVMAKGTATELCINTL